ncbi:MAG TPA: glycosyltransferase family 4 protein, partial [Terriglobales bacterium]|nr:glycosyltransferase family 4 protein [Terriglobales bacterium]
MRILLFTSQMNFVNYAQAFRSLNHQFTIVTLITKRERHRYEMTLSRFGGAASNVVYSPIYLRASNDRLASLLNPINLVHDFGKIFTTIRAWRPEAVIGMFVIHAYPLVVLKRILKFSLFALVSGSDLTFHNGLVWRLVRRAVFRNSLAVFTVAKRFNPQIERESGCTPIVIPTGTNPDYYTPLPNNVDLRGKYNFEVSDFIILSLSSLIELKRIDDVIRAVRIIKSEHPQTKMIIAGDGPEKAKLMKLCADVGVECVFTGFVGEAEKRELYNIADVYVLASRSEGMPFSVIEAMACG